MTNVFEHKPSIFEKTIYYAPVNTPRTTEYFDQCLDFKSLIFRSIYWSQQKHSSNDFCENYFCKNNTIPYFLSSDGINNPEFSGRNLHFTVHDYCLKCDHMKNEIESKYKTCSWFNQKYCNLDCGFNSTCIYHQQPLCYLPNLNLFIKRNDYLHLSLIPVYLYQITYFYMFTFICSFTFSVPFLVVEILKIFKLCFTRKCKSIFKETVILDLLYMLGSGTIGVVILSFDAYYVEEFFISGYVLLYFSIYLVKFLTLLFMSEVREEYEHQWALKVKINKPISSIALTILFSIFGLLKF